MNKKIIGIIAAVCGITVAVFLLTGKKETEVIVENEVTEETNDNEEIETEVMEENENQESIVESEDVVEENDEEETSIVESEKVTDETFTENAEVVEETAKQENTEPAPRQAKESTEVQPVDDNPTPQAQGKEMSPQQAMEVWDAMFDSMGIIDQGAGYDTDVDPNTVMNWQ